MHELLKINIDGIIVEGELALPPTPKGLVIFAHGTGSSRFSPRNNFVAQHLQRRGFATFLFDLLTKQEDQIYENRFKIELLSYRLVSVTNYLLRLPALCNLPIGYFGASTGAASAIVASTILTNKISAIVSRGGRPDLANENLYHVDAPILLIVGELDEHVMKLNEDAFKKMPTIKKLETIKGATHLFEETGTLEQVAELSGNWFMQYLKTNVGVNKG